MQRTNIYLDDDQLRVLKHISAEENKSVADLVRQAVDKYLSERLETPWQAEMNALVERVRNRVSPDVPLQEIEADIRAAKREVRETRNERRH